MNVTVRRSIVVFNQGLIGDALEGCAGAWETGFVLCY